MSEGLPVSKDGCIGCGECVAICPTAAVSCSLSPLPDCEEIRFSMPDPARVREYMRRRRSVRRYLSEPPDRDEVRELLALAGSAQTAMNVRKVSFAVLDDPAEVRRLADMCADWLEGSDAPLSAAGTGAPWRATAPGGTPSSEVPPQWCWHSRRKDTPRAGRPQ